MNIIKKKILILGSNGFFGKNLKYLLDCSDYDFIFTERKDVDVLQNDKLEELFDTIRPAIVIHCCGMIGSSESNKSLNQFNIFNTNISLNMNILSCCGKYTVEKLIVFSTYRVLMQNLLTNFHVETIEKSCIDNNSNNIGYLLSKTIMDTQINLLKKHSDIKITCFILPNIFGLFDNFCVDGRIIASLIYKIHHAKISNVDLYINSNSQTLVNIIYINDIVNIIKKSIETEIDGNIIVMNPEGTLTLNEVVDKLSEIMKFKNKIWFNDEIHYDASNTIFKNNISCNFKKYFNNFIFTPISVALQETVDHFINI